MKSIFGICLLAVCGCGGSQTGPVGAEQDDIAAYIEANPNIDEGLDEIDEAYDGTDE